MNLNQNGKDNPNWKGGIFTKDPKRYSREWRRRKYHTRKGREIILKQVKANTFKRKYGLTLQALNDMAEKQKFLCAVCHRRKRLVVDHNHETGVVRGLVCHRCNSFIGFVEKGGLEEVLDWLEKW